jgi:hypothetical protein
MVTSRFMGRRCIGGCVVLVGLIGTLQTAPTAERLTPAAPHTPIVLNLRLTVSKELPGVSQKALINESQSIWRDANVQLRWLGADNGNETERPLRILVTRRAVTATTAHQWPVGELLRFDDSTAIAMASISGALRIVQERPELPLIDLPAMRQYKLGIVLGRAVAHEIGHYLLQSNAHSAQGLMRASIDAREFADLRTGSFRLDRESQAYLSARSVRIN